MSLEHWLAAAGDLLLGARCHGCGQPWWGVCPGCRRQLASRRPFFTRPVPRPDGFPVTVTSSVYDPILRRVINAHKERQALTLTGFLAERLALSVHMLLASEPYAVGASRIVLVPIPSAARTVRSRGFDATASMARLAARRLRVRYNVTVRSAVTQARRVADQAGLDAAARQENCCTRRRPGDNWQQPDGGCAGAPGGQDPGAGRSNGGGHGTRTVPEVASDRRLRWSGVHGLRTH